MLNLRQWRGSAWIPGLAVIVAVAFTPLRGGISGVLFWLMALAAPVLWLSRRAKRDRRGAVGERRGAVGEWRASADPVLDGAGPLDGARTLDGASPLHATGSLDRTGWRWIWLLALAPVALNLLSVLVHRLAWREASWFPLLAFPLLAYLLAVCRVGLEPLRLGAAAGCGVALAVAAAAGIMHGDARTYLPVNAVVFGQIVMALAIISAWAAGETERPARERTAYSLAVLAGLAAAMAAGYRGALLMLPVVIAAFVMAGNPARAQRSSLLIRKGTVALAVVCAFGFVAGSFLSIGDRLVLFGAEWQSYQSGRIDHSSSGSRVALWQAALTMFERHVWFGVGAHQFRGGLDVLRAENVYPGDVLLFHHAHNTYLTIAAEYGLAGLLVFAVLIIGSWRGLARCDPSARRLGRCILSGWVIAAMTNDVTAHQATLRAMVLMLVPCMALRFSPAPTSEQG